MELTASGLLLLICGLLGAARAGPISWDDSKCSTKCSSGSHNFKYEPGKTYVYSYLSRTDMGLTDSREPGSPTEIRAKAEIHVKSPCEMVLKLSDVSLSGSGEVSSFKRALEANPLPFSFDDGDIRELCPTAQDLSMPFVLNTKRAILSVLKNTMKNLDKDQEIREVDIAGDCLTKYTSTKGWSGVTITKSKELSSCRLRQKGLVDVFGKPYTAQNSKIESSPLLAGKLDCKQVVSSAGILQSAECTERNVFHPLSSSGKEVAAQTEIKMTFKEERDGSSTQSGKMGRRTSLLFSKGKVESRELSGDGSQVRQILQNLCPAAKVAVQFKSPDMVAKLVAQLRVLSYETLARIYDELDRKQLCPSDVARDMFVDSLAMAGTEAPVKLMVKLAKEDKLSSFRQKIWLTAMAFNSHVDEGVVRAVLPLMKDYDLGGRQALLSLSSMVHGFCSNYTRHESEEGDCEDIPVIKELIALLQKQVGEKCKTSDRLEEQRVRETLAAFENIGRVGDAEDTLIACISSKENPLEVRHAAISAFRRTPCEEKITRKLESIFQDAGEDSAIRIYAYFGAMRCPDAQLVKAVEETLQKEQVQQVGAYVMSHLRNSKESSSPVKQDLQRLLNDVSLNQKFPSDPRKFSQYMETSAFSAKLNAGAELEGHLVRNEKTFVPKYAALNMTTYAMGHEINLLEVGFEMDGLTYWLEKMFGEDGYMSDMSMEKILTKLGMKEEGDDRSNSIDDEEGEKSRTTRDIKSGPLARMNLLHERMGVTTPNEPKVSGHLYLLGRKFAMGYESDIQKLFQVQEAFSIMEILTELAQKQKVERSFSFPIIDTEVTVPSYSGMELKLAVNATAVLGLVAEGKFDIRNLFTSERSMAIDGHFSPSAAVEVEALMSLDSGVQKTAIKVQATGHTSHYYDGKVDIKRGRIFNLQVNTPKDKIELLKFKSDMFVEKPGEQEKPLTPPALNSQDICSQFLERPLGLDICMSSKGALSSRGKDDSRQFELEVTLKKTDPSLRAYTLQIELPDEHDYNQLKYKAEFDTPGSSLDRHFLLEATLNRESEEQTLNYKIVSPFKQLDGTASLLGRPDQKKARLSLTLDQKDTYSVQGEFKTAMSSGSTEFQPSFEFHPPRGEPFIFKGSVTYNAGKKDQMVIDLNSNRPLNNPSYLRGTIVKEGEFNTRNLDGRLKVSTDISLLTPMIEARLHGTGDKQNTVYSSDMALTYKVPGKSEHNAKLIAKVQNLSTNYLSKYSTKMEATFSQLPEANTFFSWDFQHKPRGHLENDLKFGLGTHYNDEEGEILHVLQVSKIQGIEANGRKGETENRLLLNLPVLLEHEIDLNAKTSWNVAGEGKDLKPSFNVDVDFKYQEDKHVQVALNYNYISSKPVEMEIEAKFSSPKHEFLYQDRVKERSPNEYEGKTMIQWARDKRANIEYVYRIKTDSSKVHHELDLQLNTPLSRLPLQQKALFKVTKDSIDIRSHTKYEGHPLYTVEAKLARKGLSKIDISAFDVEGELEVNNDDQAKSAKLEVKNKDHSWNYGVSTELKSDRAQRSMSIQGIWNEKQDPSNSFSLVASLTKPSPRSKLSVKGRFRKDTIIDIQGDLDKNILAGTHDLSFEMMAPKMQPVRLTYHHEMEGKTAHCLLRYTRNNVQQLEVSSHVKLLTGNVVDLTAGVEVKSPNRNWDGKELSVSYKHERRSTNYMGIIKVQNSPDKPYSLDVEYTTERGPSKKIRARTVLATPLPKYRLQGALAEIEISKNVLKVTTDVTRDENKVMEVELHMQGTLAKGSGNIKLIAPFKSFKSLKAGVEVDKSSGYTTQSFLEVNDDRMLEWDSKVEYKGRSSIESTVSLRSAIGPKYDVDVHVLSENDKKNFELKMKKEDEDFFATTFLLETPGENQNAQLAIKNKGKTWILEAKKEKTGPGSRVYSLSSRGITRPIEVTLDWNHQGDEMNSKLRACHDSDCFEGEGYYSELRSPSGRWTYRSGFKAHHKPGEEISLDHTLVTDSDLFQAKLLFDLWGKTFGYESALDTGSKKEGKLVVKLPSREVHTLVNWKDEEDTVKVNLEFMTDALRQPSQKLTVGINHKSTPQNNGKDIHSSIVINHPSLSQPITAQVEGSILDGQSPRPLELKAEVVYSPDPKNKLYGELYLEAFQGPQIENLTLYVDLHSEDRQKLDMSVRSHLGLQPFSRATTGGEWTLVIPGKAWKGMTYLDMNFGKDEINYYYRSPRKNWESHLTWEEQAGNDLKMVASYIEEGQESSVRLAIESRQPCIEVSVHHKSDSPVSRYHMCADIKGNQLLSLTAESYEGEEKLTDVKILLDRKDQKSFSAHIHWRPEKLGDVLHGLMILSDKVESGTIWQRNILQVAESVRRGAAVVQGSVLSPLADHVAHEVSIVSQELATDFKHIKIVAGRIQSRLPDWEESWSRISQRLQSIAGDLKKLVDDLTPKAVEKLFQKLTQYIQEIRSRICGSGSVCYNLRYAYQRKGLEGVGEYAYGVIENMPDNYYKIVIATRDLILENLSMPSVSWEPVKEALQSMAAWGRDQLDPLMESKAVQAVKEKLTEYVDMLKKNWKEGIQTIKDDLQEQFQKLAKLQMFNGIFEGVEWEKTKKNFHQIWELLESFATDFMKQGATSNALRVLTFDPENGKIDVEIKLPKSPEEIKNVLKAANSFSREYPEEDRQAPSGTLDAVTYAQAALKQEWVPPFKAHAQLIGGQHYVTFDSTFYDFAGKCSYLLARDFADGNFSVVVKYEGQGNKGTGSIDKSIIVVAGDKIIEIDPEEETVQVDEQEVELPYSHGPVIVLRRGSTVVVEYKRGLSVTCHLLHDYCTTVISGWYYGKTAGLFGTYDHEPSNDFLRPKGQQAQNPMNFARSWEVSSGCRFRNLAQEVEIDPREPRFDICRTAFKDSSSPLQPCFQELKEEEYLKMCMRQVAIQRSASEAMCTVAAAFAHVCRQKHFPVSLPSQCLKCQSKAGESIEYGSRRRLQHEQVSQSADVVFVVEERQCNSALVKELDSISRLIDHALLDAGLTQNRYGLVAFGGQGPESPAHSHTARGKIFFDQKDLVLATARMTFRKDSGGERRDTDTFQALAEAIRYPFRVGASKTLVLVTCSRCNEDAMTVSYPDIQHLLLQRGIVLHTLSQRTISVRKSSTKAKSIYGMDAQKVFTSKDRKVEGDPDLRAQVSYPKDVCLALAQEVGGSFFTTQPVSSGSPNEAKNWKSQLGKRLAQSAQPHPCQQCDCAASDDDVPRAVCTPCRPPKPARTISNLSGDDDEY